MTAARRINARLPPDIARKVAYLERRTGKSTTQVLLEAIERYHDAIATGEHTPAQILEEARFVGCATGPRDLSARYKEELSASLKRKAGPT